MAHIATSCRVWKLRYQGVCKGLGCTSRVDSVQLERPEYWLHMIFSEAATLSQNANWIQNTTFPDIQEYYLFLALYISKINPRINKVSIKDENTEGLNPIQDGHFRCCSRMVGGQKGSLPKICHTYPTIMKFDTVVHYLKKIQKI